MSKFLVIITLTITAKYIDNMFMYFLPVGDKNLAAPEYVEVVGIVFPTEPPTTATINIVRALAEPHNNIFVNIVKYHYLSLLYIKLIT